MESYIPNRTNLRQRKYVLEGSRVEVFYGRGAGTLSCAASVGALELHYVSWFLEGSAGRQWRMRGIQGRWRDGESERGRDREKQKQKHIQSRSGGHLCGKCRARKGAGELRGARKREGEARSGETR